MTKYLTIPAADGDSLANAKIHSSETLSGLSNGTSYICYELSEASSAFTPAANVANWWTANALVDIDYANDRAYINGTAYTSVAAARTAGAITINTNGKDTVAVAPTAPYVLAAKGVTSGTIGNEYLAALDNGANTNLVYFGTGATNFAAGGYLAGGSSVLSIGNTTGDAAVNSAHWGAVRIKSASSIISLKGGAKNVSSASTNLPSGITTLVVGDRSTGSRAWSGTIGRVVLVQADLTNVEVNSLLS